MVPRLLLAALAFFPGAPAPLDGYAEEPIATGQLFSKGWPAEDRERVARLVRDALSAVEGRLGWKLGRSFTTVLAPDGFELRRVLRAIAGTPLTLDRTALGVALPFAGVLVIRGDYIPSLEPLETTVAHEVAHLVIHRNLSARVPRWLDEGLAMWLSGATLSPDEDAYMAFLARVGGLYRLESLRLRFPDSHELSSVAYEESFLFVSYLVRRLGENAIPRLLERIEGGNGAAESLQELTGLTEEATEAAFQVWVASRRSLAAALASIVNLWTVSAVLALAAILRYSLRRRRRMATFEAAEVAEAGEAEEAGETEESPAPGEPHE